MIVLFAEACLTVFFVSHVVYTPDAKAFRLQFAKPVGPVFYFEFKTIICRYRQTGFYLGFCKRFFAFSYFVVELFSKGFSSAEEISQSIVDILFCYSKILEEPSIFENE